MNSRKLVIIKSKNNKIVEEKYVYVASNDELRFKTFDLKRRLERIYEDEYPDGLLYEVHDVN